MIDMASAPPSTGSVPAPASSSSTSAGVSSAASMATMLAMWPENVLRLCGDRLLVADVGEYRLEHRDLRILGYGDEQAGLGHERQQACRLQRHGLAAGVGTGDDQHVHRRKQRDVDGNRLGVGAAVLTPASRIRPARRPGPSEGSDAPPGSAADGGRLSARAGHPSPVWARRRARESRNAPSHCSTSSSAAASTVRSRSSRAAAERVAQRQQDAQDFFVLLLLERDDVVVDFDGAERLEIEAGAAARAAVHDAGNRRPVLGANDQHVAAMAIGDDLLLEVFRRCPCRAGTTRACRAAARAAASGDRGCCAAPATHRPGPRPTGRSCGGCLRSRARRTPSVRRWREGSGTTRAPGERRWPCFRRC